VPVLAIDYTRDRLGRITRKVETIEGVTATWDYTYDPAGRLQEVYRDGTRLSRYEYDALICAGAALILLRRGPFILVVGLVLICTGLAYLGTLGYLYIVS